jgi:hypothetical protein
VARNDAADLVGGLGFSPVAGAFRLRRSTTRDHSLGDAGTTAANLATRVPSAPMTVDELRSDWERSVASEGSVSLDELVWGNNAFAFDLYHAVSDGEGNLFTLPSASPRPSP